MVVQVDSCLVAEGVWFLHEGDPACVMIVNGIN